MNRRAENKLSYLEHLRSGRQRSGVGFSFGPSVPVPSLWLPTLRGSTERSKVSLPPRLGEGAHLPTKHHAGIQPGELPVARRREGPGYALSRRPGVRLRTHSGPEPIPIPIQGPGETSGPGRARCPLQGSLAAHSPEGARWDSERPMGDPQGC